MIHIDYTPEQAEDDRLKAIGVFLAGIPEIVIETPDDLTPPGKRSWQVVGLRTMHGVVPRIRWYVRGRIYATLPLNTENFNKSNEWVEAHATKNRTL